MITKVKRGVHQPSQLVEWARQREILPRDRYALGPTGLVFSVKDYYRNVLSVFHPELDYHTPLVNNRDYKTFRLMAKAGLLQSIYGGAEKILFVVDNLHTRQTLTKVFSLPFQGQRRSLIRTMMVLTTYKQAWQEIVSRLLPLRNALSAPDWKRLVSENGQINLRDYVKYGDLIDEGLLPIELLRTALGMSVVWLEEWLRHHHPSGGIWGYRGPRVRFIRVVHGNSIRIARHPASWTYLSYATAIPEKWPRLRVHDILEPKKKKP